MAIRRILGVDPGVTTGMAMIAADGVEKDVSLVAVREVKNFLEPIYNAILNNKPDVVVCEDFVLYRGKEAPQAYSRMPAAVGERIGVVRLACEQTKIPMVLKTAHQRIRFKKPRVLRWLGMYHSSRHVRDAIAHALIVACEDEGIEQALLRRMVLGKRKERAG